MEEPLCEQFAKLSGGKYKLRMSADGKVFATNQSKKSFDVKVLRRDPSQALCMQPPKIKRDKHEHLIDIVEEFRTKNHIFVVMERLSGGSLLERLISKSSESEKNARWYFQQMVLAVDACRKMNVPILDIRLSRFLLNRGHTITKFFNPFSVVDYTVDSRSFRPADLYSAPELLNYAQQRESEHAHVWALGICLFLMIHGINFHHKKMGIKRDMSRHGDIGNNRDSCVKSVPAISHGCKMLLRKMLKTNPLQRASIETILEDPWFCLGLPKGYGEYNNMCSKT